MDEAVRSHDQNDVEALLQNIDRQLLVKLLDALLEEQDFTPALTASSSPESTAG